MDRSEQIIGGIIGLLIGDAVGVPYEFHEPQFLPPIELLEMNPPAGFQRSHQGTPVGTWSDDGALALCLLASLLDRNRLDPDDLGQRFVDWYRSGYLAVDNRVFDVGIRTANAIFAIESGTPSILAGITNNQARGNGSLMRTLPLVLWHQGTDSELIVDAHLQSRTTHGDPYCQICCALYCLWARYMLDCVPDPWHTASTILRSVYRSTNPDFLAILDWAVRPEDPAEGKGSGYVIDALRSARMVMENDSYELVIKHAISLGKDTDTTACIAGGIAGIRDGVASIPDRWRKQLRGQEIFQPLLDRLLWHRLG
ncbi:ADP-ribosylglycohydrolase family protein [Chamaesiphon sp. OTE_20_metabat_361]|uniref:ADP-ribosylglycohydrolase family protein n=1 Tax=Chamaesiphon sp. OTE_20_metabat_361 TaxID=2964689 RepID=UPI00286BD7F3|nr:ADP-ribosylglycohydrolase family protein [Chamaesiphon sp. OTE_20_metabat_361]